MLTATAPSVATSAKQEFAQISMPCRRNRKWKPASRSALTGEFSKPVVTAHNIDSEVVKCINRIAKEHGMSRSALVDRVLLKAVQKYNATGLI